MMRDQKRLPERFLATGAFGAALSGVILGSASFFLLANFLAGS